MAAPSNPNRAAYQLEELGLVEVERTQKPHDNGDVGVWRRRVRMTIAGQWVPVPLVDPRRVDDHAALRTMWAAAELTLEERHRRHGTHPLAAWTADHWATAVDVVDETGQNKRTTRRHLAALTKAGFLDRIEGDYDTPSYYRPRWHLWATQRGTTVRPGVLRDRMDLPPAGVLASIAENAETTLQMAAPPAPVNEREMTCETNDHVRPTPLTHLITNISNKSPLKHSSVVDPPTKLGGQDSRHRPRTTQAIHDATIELQSHMLRDPRWSSLATHVPNPVARQDLADAIANARTSGWNDIDQLAKPLLDESAPQTMSAPLGLLAYRIRNLGPNTNPKPPIRPPKDGFADFEPENYARLKPDKPTTDPEQDSRVISHRLAGEHIAADELVDELQTERDRPVISGRAW